MKARTVIMIAAVALLATGCRYVHQIKDIAESIAEMPTSAENVAERAQSLGSDVVLVATDADTQYVLYRQGRQMFKKEHAYRCFEVRYVQTGDDSWRASVIQSRLEEPEQPMVLTRTADNALTLTLDSISIAVTNIVQTDSTVSFNYGFDEPDRTATLYLYGKARTMADPFAETSIQQMLSLSLMMEYYMPEDSDCEIDTIEEPEIPELLEYLNAPDTELDTSIGALTYAERYAQYSRIDSLAVALGFRHREATATNDHIKLEAKGVSRKANKCYSAMEQMGKAAATSGCRVWQVHHTPHHRHCKFTIEWY